jgi:formylglycine-generating enzyme required for sulfatase activity
LEDPRRPGPFEGKWDPQKPGIAVNRRGLGPLPVGQAAQDRSPFHCHDMSGNGWEWTRDVIGNQSVPLAKPSDFDVVYLRATNYFNDKPFDFERLHEQESEAYLKPEGYVGFRVVIEP